MLSADSTPQSKRARMTGPRFSSPAAGAPLGFFRRARELLLQSEARPLDRFLVGVARNRQRRAHDVMDSRERQRHREAVPASEYYPTSRRARHRKETRAGRLRESDCACLGAVNRTAWAIGRESQVVA